MNGWSNKPAAANAAIASLFHAWSQWRGLAEPERWTQEGTQSTL